jgi:hypothetical protein
MSRKSVLLLITMMARTAACGSCVPWLLLRLLQSFKATAATCGGSTDERQKSIHQSNELNSASMHLCYHTCVCTITAVLSFLILTQQHAALQRQHQCLSHMACGARLLPALQSAISGTLRHTLTGWSMHVLDSPMASIADTAMTLLWL